MPGTGANSTEILRCARRQQQLGIIAAIPHGITRQQTEQLPLAKAAPHRADAWWLLMPGVSAIGQVEARQRSGSHHTVCQRRRWLHGEPADVMPRVPCEKDRSREQGGV